MSEVIFSKAASLAAFLALERKSLPLFVWLARHLLAE
jgi:hypothetical protein